MAKCMQCNQELTADMAFCTRCGAKTADSQQGTQEPLSAGSDITEEDLSLFMGKNADGYIGKFRTFGMSGRDSFALTWHWPAFFFGFWWMLYRKLWLWAGLWLFLALLSRVVPFGGLVMMLTSAITANYLYYIHVKKKVAALKTLAGTDNERSAVLAREGGVSNILVVIAPLIIIALIAILAAIAIPQFAMYRQKAADMRAKQEIQQACSVGQTIFRVQPEKTEVEPNDLLYGGLKRTEEVEMMLLDGRRETFSLSASHVMGKKTWYMDRDCALREEEKGSNYSL